MSVWDIGGQSLSSKNLPNYIMGSSAIFICYDTTDVQSFHDLEDWMRMITRSYSIKNKELNLELEESTKKNKTFKPMPMPEIYCVGNKIDLIQYRRVTESMHLEFQTRFNLTGSFFVSAQSGENVLTTFYKVAGQSCGIELSSDELEFTKKVLAVTISGDSGGGGRTKGSKLIEDEDDQAHNDVMNMFGAGGQEKPASCNGCTVS